MALGIYTAPDVSAAIIEGVRPIIFTFDGSIGGHIDKRLYVRNDDLNYWYSDIAIRPIDTINPNLVNNLSAGFTWKLMEKDITPTIEEWELIGEGNQLSFDVNIGTSTLSDKITFLPFWLRVSIPRGQKIQTLTDMALQITATENLIDG